MQAIYRFNTEGQFCGFYIQLTKEEAAYFQKASQEQGKPLNKFDRYRDSTYYGIDLYENVIYITTTTHTTSLLDDTLLSPDENFYQAECGQVPELITAPSTKQLSINEIIEEVTSFTSPRILINNLLAQFPDAPEQMRETMNSIKEFVEDLAEKYNQTRSEATSANISCMDLFKSQVEEFKKQVDDKLDKVIPVKHTANTIQAYLGLMMWNDADVFASDEPSMTEASQRSMVIS